MEAQVVFYIYVHITYIYVHITVGFLNFELSSFPIHKKAANPAGGFSLIYVCILI